MFKIQEYLIHNIKFHRKRLKITQEKLAELIDVSANYIGRIEIGYHFPSPEIIEKLCNIFEIEPYELFLNPYNLSGIKNDDNKIKQEMLVKKLMEKIEKTIKRVIYRNEDDY